MIMMAANIVFPPMVLYSVGISTEGESVLHMQVKPDTLYKLTLRLLDADGDIVMSRSVTARTLAAQTPTPTPTPTTTPTPTATPTAYAYAYTPTDDPAVNFSVSGFDHSSVTLQWGTAPGNRGIASARIRAYERTGSEYRSHGDYSVGISAATLRVSRLNSGTLYRFTLRFLDADDAVVTTKSVTARTLAAPATPTPTATPTATPTDDPAVNFRVSAVSSGTISLVWGPAPRNRGIASAEIVRYDHDGSEYRFPADGLYSVGISTEGESVLHMQVKPDTLYKLTLRLLDADDAVVTTKSVTVRTQTRSSQAATPTPTPNCHAYTDTNAGELHSNGRQPRQRHPAMGAAARCLGPYQRVSAT